MGLVTPPQNKTVLGVDEKLEAVFTYIFGWASGIVFLFIEKDNQYVRFHALQSIVFSLGATAVYFILLFIPIIGWALIPVAGLLFFILWIYLIVKTYQGENYKLYIIGDWVESQLHNIK